MRIKTALAMLVLAAASVLQTPARADAPTRAQLRLSVVDETLRAVPGATVTIFTLDGNPGISVTADQKGVALFPDLPVGLAEVYARSTGYGPYIEAMRLRSGENAERATLIVKPDEADSPYPDSSTSF